MIAHFRELLLPSRMVFTPPRVGNDFPLFLSGRGVVFTYRVVNTYLKVGKRMWQRGAAEITAEIVGNSFAVYR